MRQFHNLHKMHDHFQTTGTLQSYKHYFWQKTERQYSASKHHCEDWSWLELS